MTIPFLGDKIAPVADDGALKSRRKLCQPETRRRNSRGQESGTKGAGSAEKTDEKSGTKGAGSAEKTDEKNC